MAEWKECILSDVCIVINGRAYSHHELLNSGKYKVVRVGNLAGGDKFYYSDMELDEDKYCFEGDLLYAWACSFNSYIWKEGKTIFHYHVWKLLPKEGVLDKIFFYFYLKHVTPMLLGKTNGSVMQHITKSLFENTKLSLPSLTTQKKIATILSSLDDKIELNNKINANLEQQAQALFKSWFIDFEPFGGKMPEGWKEGKLSEIADYLNGLAMQKFRPKENEVGLPVLKIKELRQGSCDESSELCSPSTIKPDFIIHDGDVIFSWSGSLLVDIWCGGTSGLNQHLFRVTSQKYDKWFYFLWTKHHLDRFIFLAADKATTMGHIKREELDKAKVVIPDNEVYSKLTMTLSPIIDIIIKNRIENRKLASLRDYLLPELMSGNISVEDVKL